MTPLFMKEIALTRLAYDYYQKGFGRGKIDKQILESFLSKQIAETTVESQREELKKIQENLEQTGLKIADNAMADKFITSKNDTLTLSEILTASRRKILVLDFWASWCAPCLKEIKESKELRTQLTLNKNAEWIFISIDHQKQNWLNDLKNLNVYMDNYPQYLLSNLDTSGLIDYLSKGHSQIFTIPSYIVINADGEIISFNAPRPSDPKAFLKVFEGLDLLNK